MRTIIYTLLATAVIGMGATQRAHAQFAGTSDYLYTVLYEETSPNVSLMDLFYDYELYLKAPHTGHWQLVAVYPTRAEAEFWAAMSSQYETQIIAVYAPAVFPRYQATANRVQVRGGP